jgi:putative DNA primase/helicase
MGIFQNTFDATKAEWIDFPAVKLAANRAIDMLLSRWLPGGRRQGVEYVVKNPTRSDSKPGSFSINLKTGVWSDFATGERGGDMIDLLVYLIGKAPLDAAREIGDLLGVKTTTASIHPFSPGQRASTVLPPQEVLRDPATFPYRTAPDSDGQPRFIIAGDEGPAPRVDELRRHAYRVGTTPVKIKIMRKGNSRAMIWYRVADVDGRTGWQSRKPEDFKEVPFIGVIDPFDPDNAELDLYCPEGERDTETLAIKGFASFAFGGTGDGTPSGWEEYARGRRLVVLADNDPDGIAHAKKKALMASTVATSVRIIFFDDLPPKGDVTDWFAAGGTADGLHDIVDKTPLFEAPRAEKPEGEPQKPAAIKATPYSWIEPESIPKRDFIYGRHLIRKFVSATVAPGGVGKSSLEITEVLAMVSGVDLLGIQPHGRSRVWLWNLEDPREEIARHIQATAKHFLLSPKDIDGRLCEGLRMPDP